MQHMSPILARFGGGTMTTEDDTIRDVQAKLRKGGFKKVAVTGELDEATCEALRKVGAPRELIEECGECVESTEAVGSSYTPPRAQLSPEAVRLGGLLAMSAVGVFGLWATSRKQEKARVARGYQAPQEVVDVPFEEIEGEQVSYKYLTSGNEAAQNQGETK